MPVRQWRLSKDDEDTKNLEETIFLYAKKNLAVVNVYIKVFLLTLWTLEIDEVVKTKCLVRRKHIYTY